MNWSFIRSTIEGGFFYTFRELVRSEVIPYQWKALKDEIPGAPKSHSVENFRIAGGHSTGEYEGMVFQDSDLYKWLEAVGFLLADGRKDAEAMSAWCEEAVALIAEAQQPDGYINTYFTVKEPNRRWKNLREAHELYCAGHLIEAGVSVYRGTGNERILQVVRKLADHIDHHFGSEEGKIHGYPGHEEVELALVKLYRLTGEKRYLDLAKYFVDERGKQPLYFELEAKSSEFFTIFGIKDNPYAQCHIPVREQVDAVGHAVRAMYLYIAMADIAKETGDETLRQACERLWLSATKKKMYLTGGIGSSAIQEAFSVDYDLPNDTAYAETCAAIGLFIFSNRMAVLTNEAQYADVMERTIFNGILSGLAADGHSYFYVNPLEVVPEICDGNPTHSHVKYRRQAWYGCACCPPNIARLFGSLGEYTYHSDGSAIYLDLYHQGALEYDLGSTKISLYQRTEYPWNDTVTIEYTGSVDAVFDVAVRIPEWCPNTELSVNGEALSLSSIHIKGYAHIQRTWFPGDKVLLRLPMEPRRVYAHPLIRSDWGKVAIMRGPMVYCLEEEDNGPNLHSVTLPRNAPLVAVMDKNLFGGTVVIKAEGRVLPKKVEGDEPYINGRIDTPVEKRSLTFIPYYAWANRSPGEMIVWVQEHNDLWKTN